MSGFMNDEQIEAHKGALAHEREGYEARVAAAKAAGDDGAVARYQGRIEQVDAELKKAQKLVSQEHEVDETGEKPERKRGARKKDGEGDDA